MEKNWLASYPGGVPEGINPDAYSSVVDVFLQSCETYADCDAYSLMGTRISYKTLHQLASQFAAFCQEKLGLQKGDRIGLMMPNILQYPVALFGSWLAGLTVMNLNPLYTADELVLQLSNVELDCLLVLENFAATVMQLKKTVAVAQVIITGVGDLLGFPKSTIVNAVVKHVKRAVPYYRLPTAIQFKTVISQGKYCALKAVEMTGDDIALFQPTGGTTGVSKAAMLTHRNLVANLQQLHAWVENDLEHGKEVMMTPLPIYHIFSLSVNVLVMMKIGGHNVLIPDPRDLASLINVWKKENPTLTTGVNTLFNAMVNHSDFKTADFSNFKIALAGGMATLEEVANKWEAMTNKPLLAGYGLTEASPVVSASPLGLKHFDGSIGLPLPSTEVKFIDDAGKEVNIGEPGELCVRGPQVMKGYFKNEKETNIALSEDGLLMTGDIGVINEKGFITLIDRKKDMIIVSGFNVYPTEIEEVIMRCQGVLEVAVVGEPCVEHGERVKAVIVKKDAHLAERGVINYCKEHLTRYKVPDVVEFVDSLPKNNVGKVLRRKLRSAP